MASPFDPHVNGAYSTVATAPSPATSGTTLTVAPGDGSKFTTGANAVLRVKGNALPIEIVRVTAISTDTLTVTRAQEGTAALAVDTTYEVYQGSTAKVLTDIEVGVWPIQYVAHHQEDFVQAAGHYLSSSSGTAASVATDVADSFTAGIPGVMLLDPGSAANGYAFVWFAPGSTNVTNWKMNLAGQWQIECRFHTPATLGVSNFRFGLCSNGTVNPPPSWVGLEILSSDTTFHVVTRDNGVQTIYRDDTGVTPTASTWYTARVWWDGSTFWYAINRGTATSATTCTTNYAAKTSATTYAVCVQAINGSSTPASDQAWAVDYVDVQYPGLSR